MSRPLRLEWPGALYHVTARGNRRESIYLSDRDRREFDELLAEVCDRFNWSIHAYCQMGNHYHLVVETPDANLSAGMRQLNGVYTQRFNRAHGCVGHLFQGRYAAILVEKEAYLLELVRYVLLNPVRARMVRRAEDWPWSSARSQFGWAEAPVCLDLDWVLSRFAGERRAAMAALRSFVAEGRGQPAPWEALRNQVFLGSDAFVEQMQEQALALDGDLREVPASKPRPPAGDLSRFERDAASRDEAIVAAYRTGAWSMREIGAWFGLHYSRVSRIVKSRSPPR